MKRQITEIERELGQRSSRSKLDDRNDNPDAIDHLTGPHIAPSNLTTPSIANNVAGRERDRDTSYTDPELEALDPLGMLPGAESYLVDHSFLSLHC